MKRPLIFALAGLFSVGAVVGSGVAYWSFDREYKANAIAASIDIGTMLGDNMKTSSSASIVFDQNQILLTQKKATFNGAASSYQPLENYQISYTGDDAESHFFSDGYFYVTKDLYPYLNVKENGQYLFKEDNAPEGLFVKNVGDFNNCYFLPLNTLDNVYIAPTGTKKNGERRIYTYDLELTYAERPRNIEEYNVFASIINSSKMGFAFKKDNGEFYVVNYHDKDGSIIETKRLKKTDSGSVTYTGKSMADTMDPVPVNDSNFPEYTDSKTGDHYKYFSTQMFAGWSRTKNAAASEFYAGSELSSDTLSRYDTPLDLYPVYSSMNVYMKVDPDNGNTPNMTNTTFMFIDDNEDVSTHTMERLFMQVNEDGSLTLTGTDIKWEEGEHDLVFRESYNGLPLTGIADGAFNGDQKINTVSFPSTIKTIGSTNPDAVGAFEGCSNLTSIVIEPNSLAEIGCNAFKDCQNLKKAIFPEGVTEIHEGAFQQTWRLEEVEFPSTLTKIGARAFKDAESLSSLYIPNTLKEIGDEAFEGISPLSSVTFEENNEGLTIGARAFAGNNQIKKVVLPEGCVSVGYQAFAESQIQSVTFSSTIITVEDEVFANNWSINTIVLKGNAFKVFGENVFKSKNETWDSMNIYVPVRYQDREDLLTNFKIFCRGLHRLTMHWSTGTTTGSFD